MRIKLAASLILLIVLVGAYLLFMYARFYNTIGEHNLQSPYKQNQFVLQNSQKAGSVKYVALGDSLTAGVGSDAVESTFVYQKAMRLAKQFGRVDVVNLGVPGATSEDLIAGQLKVVINEQPDYVTLLIGVNDIHNKVSIAEYVTRMSRILDELLTKTSAQIVLINLPYLGASEVLPFPLSGVLDIRTKQFNKILEKFNYTDRIKLVDLYTPTRWTSSVDSKYYAADHFHPSGEGYLFWGKIINAD